MRSFNESVEAESKEQVNRKNWLVILLLALAGPCVYAEDEWLNRSQQILNALAGRPRPSWLDTNPYQAEAQRQALDIVNASKPLAMGATLPSQQPASSGKPLRVMYISFSLGEAVLKGVFEDASGQDDVLLVFRGPKPGQKLPAFFADLKMLLKDIEPVPNIVIDPTRFQKWQVTMVPEIIVEDNGKDILRVKGVTSLDWLSSRQSAGRHTDLGRFGEIYEIAEIDLLEEIKRRLAAMDWPQKQQQAIARFWETRKFEMLPSAQEDRNRVIDLTVTAPRDLVAANGQLIIRAGQTINPLEKMPFSLCLVVFDATEKSQVQAAQQLSCQDKKARVMYLATQLPRQDGWEGLKTLETTLNAPVFLLTSDVRQRFQLQHVPAVIEQAGNRIAVHERKVRANAAKEHS